MKDLRHLFLFLVLLHPLLVSSTDSPITLIPLTIFKETDKTWYEAVDLCYDNFDVRLASNDYSLKNLVNVIEDDGNSAQVWTGIFKRGVINSEWRNQDGEVVNLNALQITMCEEPVKEGNCLLWKKRTPNVRSCFQPKNCSERLDYYACEVLKFDFESEILSRYDKLFTGWEISTGVLSHESSLNFGPLVDHTLHDIESGEVNFAGRGTADASSIYQYNDANKADFTADSAYYQKTRSYWCTTGDNNNGILEESIWFSFTTPLIVNQIHLRRARTGTEEIYYPMDESDTMSFFGSDSPNCDEDQRQTLATDISTGFTSIDNRRKFVCYGIHARTIREVKYVALAFPIKYYEMKCQQNCKGKFASIFEKREEMNFDTGGASNVHWEVYSYMSKSTSINGVQDDYISIGSNFYNHSNEEWTLRKGNDTTFNMKYNSNSKLIAIDDMSFKQDPINRICDPGKFGTNCQKMCDCQGRGSCYLSPGTGNCDCEDGFYGPDCQGEISCLPLTESSNCSKSGNLRFGTTCELTCDDGYELMENVSASIICKQKVPNQEESYWKGLPEHLDHSSDFCEDINECTDKNECNGKSCINTLGDFKCDCGSDLVGKQCKSNLTGIEKPENVSINCISGEKCQITVPISIPSFAVFYTLKALTTLVNRRSTSTEEIVMFKDCEAQAGYLPLFYNEKGDANYSTINLQDGKVMNGPCQNTRLKMGQDYEIRFSIETNVTNFLDRREFFWQYIKINSAPPIVDQTTTIIVAVCVALILILILLVVIVIVKRRGQKRKNDVNSQPAVYDYPSVTFDRRQSNSTTGTNGMTGTNGKTGTNGATVKENLTFHDTSVSIENRKPAENESPMAPTTNPRPTRNKNPTSPMVKSRPSKKIPENVSPTSVPIVDIFEKVFESNKRSDDYKNEFESLPSEKLFGHEAASLPENKAKNRFQDIPAYDHSRVILGGGGGGDKPKDGDVYANVEDEKKSSLVNAAQKSDYINANYVDGFDGKNRAFIACQGPKKQTVDDFWQMIWTEKVDTIVMLTNLVEGGKKKCEKYWPNDVNEPTDFGEIGVTMVQEYGVADYVTRILKMTRRQEKAEKKPMKKSRTVKLYHFTAWPDMGVPSSPMELTSFLHFIKKECEAELNKTSPIVVHCSAGVGRTGTFIALWNLLDEAKAIQRVNVLETVKKLRNFRYMMVQNDQQYQFIYENIAVACYSVLEPVAIHAIVNFCGTRLGDEYLTSLVVSLDVLCRHVQSDDLYEDPTNNKAHITATIDGYSQKNSIKVSESPSAGNLNDFAATLHQSDIKTVIKLGPTDDDAMPELQPTRDFDIAILEVSGDDDDALCRVTKAQLKPKDDYDQLRSRPVHYYELKSWPELDQLPSKKDLYNFTLQVLKQQQQRGNPPMLVHFPKGRDHYAIFIVLLHILERMNAEKLVHIPGAVMKAHPISSKIVDIDHLDLCFQIAKWHQEQYDTYSNFQ